MAPTTVKILIVDDDPVFRDILQKCIEGTGALVLAADSVEMARQATPLFGPQIILSDVKMPKETGIDLLRWAGLNHPEIPVVIMTGFSEILDASNAATAGAAAFLTKPFREEELFKIFSDILNQVDSKTKSDAGTGSCIDVKPEDEYMKVSIEDFLSGSQLETPIFVRVPSNHGTRFIKVAHKGEDLTLDRIKMYKEKGLKHLYLSKNDFLEYLGMSIKLSQAAAKTNLISAEKKTHLMRHTLETIGQQFFESKIDEDVFSQAATMVETSIAVLSSVDNSYNLLEALKELGDEMYAHASGVSLVASMIGKSLGWTSPKTLGKVAMAGLLHDIGKKQFPKELTKKTKAQMNAEEEKLYETHPRKGLDILSEQEFIPSEVIQAVYQHHERVDGTGFPAHLTDSKIYPLAKVIAVADIFCHFYMGSGNQTKDVAKTALQKMMDLQAQGLWPEALAGLHRSLGVDVPASVTSRIKTAKTK